MSGVKTNNIASFPTLGRRIASWFYEGILLFGVGFTVILLLIALGAILQIAVNGHLQVAVLFIIFGIYCTWFWFKGQTLAMQTWSIRIVDVEGRPITQFRAIGRYCLSYLWIAPPLILLSPFQLALPEVLAAVVVWMALWAMSSHLHPQKQFWHDALAGTRLVLADDANG